MHSMKIMFDHADTVYLVWLFNNKYIFHTLAEVGL